MPGTCVVGLQWGDEAKGKIVDLLGDQHDFVVRYNGGANAGHTVVAGGKTFKLSLLPTGVIRPNMKSVIGNGVVVYPPRFLEEVEQLRKGGIDVERQPLAQRPCPRHLPVSHGRGATHRERGGGERSAPPAAASGPAIRTRSAAASASASANCSTPSICANGSATSYRARIAC